MRTAPEVHASRPAAESALWSLMIDGRAEASHDRRYGALVLLATFASLRLGEVTALRRCDLDLTACTVRVRAAFVERSTGGLVLGPPKSDAGRRVVGFPPSIVPALRDHLAQFVGPEPGALLFTGVKGGPIRRSNFNKLSGWPYEVRAIGAEGLHVHDLRHSGNHLAAISGVGLRDLMARMGRDSERAAMIYQHAVRGADRAITSAIEAQIEAERTDNQDGGDGPASAMAPVG